MSSTEGSISIYGQKDHAHYHTLRLHSKTVLDFHVHTSGRLMVSFGAEGKIKLTDLATTSEVYHKNVKTRSRRITQMSSS